MTRYRNSNVPTNSGMAVSEKDNQESYWYFERLPQRVRIRLAEATLPIDPVSLYHYWRRGLDNRYEALFVEQKVIEAIEKTEALAAEHLSKDRASWNLGEDMAKAIKESISRRMSPAPR